jgi:hypothetical protein
MDDEAMRVWLSAAENRSASGERIWQEGVVGRSFKRSPALRASFAKSAVQVLTEKNGVLRPAVAITIPEERADRYFIRIVKGLLTQLYPELDYSAHAFKVNYLEPLRADDVAMLRHHGFAYDGRGNGVLRFFHGVLVDPPMGSWVLIFYGWACFSVVHQPREGLPLVGRMELDRP